MNGHSGVAEVLLQKGADVNAKNEVRYMWEVGVGLGCWCVCRDGKGRSLGCGAGLVEVRCGALVSMWVW